MKIIFLDVDGVLNCYASTSRCGDYIGIDDDKVTRLKQIVEATGAEIVLSSTWRLGYNREGHELQYHGIYLNKKLTKQNLKILDVTPDLDRVVRLNGWGRSTHLRGKEINQWLSEHPDVTDFIILDDEMFDFGHENLLDKWYQTEYYTKNGGIQDEDVPKIINLLGGNKE